MPPDLNSLPPSTPSSLSGSPLQRHRRPSMNESRPSPPSPRSPSLSSLQAAAAINAGMHRSPSNASPARNGQLERRRSSLMNNLSINDPTIPPPGEMQQSNGSNSNSPRLGRRALSISTADPHHQRPEPSLGELHQELENEQEAQVNRLLHMIRTQQEQIAQIQRQQSPQDPSHSSTEQAHTPATPSNLNNTAPPHPPDQSSPRSASISGHPYPPFNRPHSLSRQSSARLSNAGTNSHSGSPGLRPVSGSLGPLTEDFLLGGTRDETAFYQAETQMLTRENQMLKLRIRELERQISEMSTSGHNIGGQSHSPAQMSPLASTPATFAGEAVPAIAAEVEPTVKID